MAISLNSNFYLDMRRSGPGYLAPDESKVRIIGLDSPELAPRQDVRQNESSSWDSLLQSVFGKDENNTRYEDCFTRVGQVKKVEKTHSPEEREKILEENEKVLRENASYLLLRSQEVLNLVEQNTTTGKNSYSGLTIDKGVPMSSAQMVHTDGYSPEDQYNYNLLCYFYARAILENVKIFASYDMDGTLTDKILSQFATRRMQPISQLFESRMSMDTSIEYMNTEVMINTARSLVQTVILANLEGPESRFTYAIHNSAIEEICGSLFKAQHEMLEKIDIAAANGGIKSHHNARTYISDSVKKGIKLLKSKSLGDGFIDKVFKGPAQENENSSNEPKALNKFLMDHENFLGENYYQHYIKIMQFWQEEVINGQGDKESRYRKFRERVLDDPDYGVNVGESNIPILEREINDLEDKLKDRKERLKACVIDKTDPSADLIEEIQQYEAEINDKKLQCSKYIRLIGTESSKKKIEAAGKSWNDVGKGKPIPNFRELLDSNPEEFFEAISSAEKFGYCTHFFNSRGTPDPDAIHRAISNLRQYQYQYDSDNNPDVRREIRKINKEFYNDSQAESNREIDKYVETGKSKVTAQTQDSYIDYINWRLANHAMHNYSKQELQNCNIFEKVKDPITGEEKQELQVKKEIVASWKTEWQIKKQTDTTKTEANEYRKWLKDKFRKHEAGLSTEISNNLARYLKDILPKGVFNGSETLDINGKHEEYFMPDEFFAIKGKNQYTGKDSQLAIFRLDEKSDPLRKEGQFYFELLPNKGKDSVIPSFLDCLLNRKTIISSGDTASDVPAHAAAIMRGGVARVIYNIIDDKDIHNEIIDQQIKLVDNIKNAGSSEQEKLEELYVANKHFGIVGLQKDNGNYKKVTVEKDDTGTYSLKVHDELYSKESIEKEAQNLCRGRIVRYRSPGHLIASFTDLTELMSGKKQRLEQDKFSLAAQLHAKKKQSGINSLTQEEQKLYLTYEPEITELENTGKLPIDAPRFRVFYEYVDEKTGDKYYRFKSDGRLYSREEDLFVGDEKSLKQNEVRRDKNGVFTYKEDGKPFDDPDLLNKLLIEDTQLPSPSPVSGLFASKGFLKFLGGGTEEKGTQRLERFLGKLPKIFSGFLEWCGALMAIGGLMRLITVPFADEENSISKAGYWVSNTARACSALGASFRGILNVNRLWDITAGEVINIFSALFLGNGMKHAGFALGNVFLFTGRGLQAAQRAQRINAFTEKEIKEKKLDPNTIDPRPYVRDLVKFSLDGVVLPVKHAFQRAGMSGVMGEICGRLASAAVTPIKVLKDIVSAPKLIGQVQGRKSEKNGVLAKLVPSNGHLLALTGILSGLGALIAGTFGRLEKAGEIAENGFNKIGSWGISLATSVAALGIISNGFEVAANTQGLPRVFRGLDGQDVRYNPKRAGLGQVFAGIGYAIIPLFGLHRDWVASLFDITTGFYFGLPGTKMSVAQEEIPNSFNLAKSVLIEGQRFYKETPMDLSLETHKELAPQYTYNEEKGVYEPPILTQAA